MCSATGSTSSPSPTDADLAVAQGAIVRADAVVDAAFLDRTPRMRVLARTGVGTDLVDLETATARGIAVVVTPGSGTRAVAEGVLAHALALVKRLGPLPTLIREGRWAERTAGGPLGDLDGATIGIIGYGRIGRRVGELAAAFGMRVLAYDPFAPPPAEVACSDLDELVAASDVLTLHVPLTAENHHMVNAEFLGAPSRAPSSSTAAAAACSTSTPRSPRWSPGSSPGSASTCSSPSPRRTTRSSTTRRDAHPAPDGADPAGNGADLRRRRAGRRRRPRRPEPGRGGQPGLGALRGCPGLIPYPL